MATQGKPQEPQTRSTLGALQLFLERRALSMLVLGFSAGLPFLLIFDTLSAWLRDAGASLEVIGFFGLATLSYSLKFVWAPLVDRTTIPGLTKILGHRRSWILATQIFIVFGLWSISGLDPSQALGTVALFAVLVGFAGATQDIVIDAWRIESSDDARQGTMAAAYQWGYRIAQLIAGAVPLVLAEFYTWNFSYAVMAALMLVGVGGVFFAPREKAHVVRPIPVQGVPSRPGLEGVEWVIRLLLIALAAIVVGTGLTGETSLAGSTLRFFGASDETASGLKAAYAAKPSGIYLQVASALGGLILLVLACWPIPRVPTRPGAYLAGSFGTPLKDFFQRFAGQAALILALICLYRLSDFVLNIMNPFYQDLGFTKIEIAEARKVFGVIASTFGVFIGGLSVARFGLIRTMVLGAFASPLSNLVFAWLATQGHYMPGLFFAIGIDNVATGYAGTALIAYMSSLTSIGFTATQYALFSSLYSLPGKLVASQSGRVVELSAKLAEAGPLTFLTPLFSQLTAESYMKAAELASVSPAAMGAGYLTFFLYSTALGIAAIILAFFVAARSQPTKATTEA